MIYHSHLPRIDNRETSESVRITLIEEGFAPADLSPSTLVSALRDEKKDHLIALTKSAGLIKELVDKSLHPLLNNKTAAEMWTILKNTFQHISPMSVTWIFSDTCSVKLSDCIDIIDYTSRYQTAFDKILSLINGDSWMSKKTIEMTLQGNLLRHLGKDCSALVSAIETAWKEETTDLSDHILRITRHAEISKGNQEDTAENDKVLAAGIHRAPNGTCTPKNTLTGGSQTIMLIDARSNTRNFVHENKRIKPKLEKDGRPNRTRAKRSTGCTRN